MSLSDPIADALTRIRNASMASHINVQIRYSKTIIAILQILKTEGFIGRYSEFELGSNRRFVKVSLRYYKGKGLIQGIKRVSKPGRRVYVDWENIGDTLNNMGVGVITTSKGILSDKQAKYEHVGGEYLCKVW